MKLKMRQIHQHANSEAETSEDEDFVDDVDQESDAEDCGIGRRLRNRANIPPIDRFGVPVAHMSEAGPLTVDAEDAEDAVSGADAEKWKMAMAEELSALEANNTWVLMNLHQASLAVNGYLR